MCSKSGHINYKNPILLYDDTISRCAQRQRKKYPAIKIFISKSLSQEVTQDKMLSKLNLVGDWLRPTFMMQTYKTTVFFHYVKASVTGEPYHHLKLEILK